MWAIWFPKTYFGKETLERRCGRLIGDTYDADNGKRATAYEIPPGCIGLVDVPAAAQFIAWNMQKGRHCFGVYSVSVDSGNDVELVHVISLSM